MTHRPKYQMYTDMKGEHRVRFIAGNGRIIGNLAEGYKRKADLVNAMKIIKRILALNGWMLEEPWPHTKSHTAWRKKKVKR